MAGKPADPSPSDAPQGEREDREQPQEGERFGPLALERLGKEDGRALILYREATGGEHP